MMDSSTQHPDEGAQEKKREPLLSPTETRTPKKEPVGDGVAALVAMTRDGIIGNNGDLPWRLSSDLRRFKQITMGGVLIMGRKTYDSIGRPLPGRKTIVLTRNANWQQTGVLTASNPREAIVLSGEQKTFVVGGAEIYRQLLPYCDQILLTRVLAEIEGDTKIDLDLTDFEASERSEHPAGERDEYATEFIRYKRRKRS